MRSVKSGTRDVSSSSMELTSTEDDEGFKAKFENLKILVKHFQKELNYQRLRSEGLQSIAKCLEEERDENISLRSRLSSLQQQKQKETVTVVQGNVPSDQAPATTEVSNKRDGGHYEAKAKILEGQVEKLTSQLVEVTQMNAKWQEYNQQREQYVGELLKQIGVLEERGRVLEKTMHDTDKVKTAEKTKLDEIVQAYQERINWAEEQLNQHQEQHKVYAKQCKHLDEQAKHLQHANAYLSSQLKAKGNSDGDAKEKIEMLEAQIRICTEDFESERRDRERAVAKIGQLEKEVRQLRMEKDALTRHRAENHHERRQAALHNYQTAYESAYQPAGHQGVRLVPHGIVYHTDGPAEEDGDAQAEGFDTVDAPRAQAAASPPGGTADVAIHKSIREEEKLQCPKCGKAYPVTKHTDLLEHIDTCCE